MGDEKVTSTTLKLIALVLMLLDHIYEFINGAPIWLTWLGRLSAPLFIFCMVWGLHYTHDRKKYLLNMYLWGVGMSVGDVALALLVSGAKTLPMNNIFVTLLLTGMIVAIIEGFRGGDKKLAKQLLWLLIGAQVISFVLVPIIMMQFPQIYNAFVLPAAIFPSLLFCEGSFIWVGMGVVMYFVKENKTKLVFCYTIFSLYWMLMPEFSLAYESMFLQNFQWMMIGSLPLMLCYNGNKGYGLKWLFYAFYPAHIYILCWVGSFVSL